MQETSAVDLPTLGHQPHELWLGMVRYYGRLCTKPGWEHLHPQFDFVKQLSTSVVSIDFFPSLLDDKLYISKIPMEPDGDLPRRVVIDAVADQRVLFTCYPGGNGEPAQIDAPRESALDALWRILQEL